MSGNKLQEANSAVASFYRGPPHEQENTDRQSATYRSVEQAIRSTKGSSSASIDISEDDMRRMLGFLGDYASKKKAVRGRILETMSIVLSNDTWYRAAHVDKRLVAKLLELAKGFDSGAAEEVQQKMMDVPPALPAYVAPTPPPPQASEQDDETWKCLISGVEVMRSFDWVFPGKDHQTLRRDEALAGFKSFETGMNKLHVKYGGSNLRPKDPKPDLKLLQDLKLPWREFLQFLETLCNAKSNHKAKVQFVVDNLEEFSQDFRNYLQDGSDLHFLQN
mmetsp:Transcript_123/g.186  ORF Transcript_123/g.186 Transcript_123/m.186 type:complete len:277 (-) Transcript_123:185-1015(-)